MLIKLGIAGIDELDWASNGKVGAEFVSTGIVFPAGARASLGDGVDDPVWHSEGPAIQDRTSFKASTLELDWASNGKEEAEPVSTGIVFPVGTMASFGDGVDGPAWHSEGPGIQDRTSFTISTLELDWASNNKVEAEPVSTGIVFPVGTMASFGDGVDGPAWHSEGPGIQDRTSFTVSTFELDWTSKGKVDAEIVSTGIVFPVGTVASLGDGVDGLAWHSEGPGIQDCTSLTASTLELDWASNGRGDAKIVSTGIVFVVGIIALLGDGGDGVAWHSEGPENRTVMAVTV